MSWQTRREEEWKTKQQREKTRRERERQKDKERQPEREREMLARTLRKQLTRSRTGTGQACFQHNLHFPFVKCRGLLCCRSYQQPVEGLWGPWGEGPRGLGSPPYHLDRTIQSIHALLHLNLSAAPTHHSTGMSYWWTDQSSDGAVCAQVCSRGCVCVCEQEREKYPHRACINITNTPLHMSTYVTLLMTSYITHTKWIQCLVPVSKV